MPSRKIEDLRPEFQVKASVIINRANAEIGASLGRPITAVVTMTKRSTEEQAALYAKGRTTIGSLCTRTVCQDCGPGGHGHTVTNGKPGHSYHEYGLAFDVMLLDNGKVIARIEDPAWAMFGKIVDSERLCWGGHWMQQDGPHVEMHPAGMGCRDAAKLRPAEVA